MSDQTVKIPVPRRRPTLQLSVVNDTSLSFARELRRLTWRCIEASLPEPQTIWTLLLKLSCGGADVNGGAFDIENALVSQDTFRALREELRGSPSDSGDIILSSTTWTKFAAGRDRVSLVSFFGYLAKKILVVKIRCSLELCCEKPFGEERALPSSLDVIGVGNRRLSRDDIEAFIADQLPHLRLSRDCLPWMVPYYMAHCSAKLMFAADVHRSRTVDIDALIANPAFNELLLIHEQLSADAVVTFPVGCAVEVPEAALSQTAPLFSVVDPDGAFLTAVVVGFEADGRSPDNLYHLAVGSGASQRTYTVPRESLYVTASTNEFAGSQDMYSSMLGLGEGTSNWFALTNCISIYLHFCSLDRDSDGMLSKEELQRYNYGSFSDIVIHRVFDVHVTGNQNARMDYKAYLDFVVANEYPGLSASVKYFWKILDIAETREFIHMDILRQFCVPVAQRLVDEGLMSVTADSILAEIVDLINPAEVDRVTLDDVFKCGQAALVLPVMLDYRCFFNYDNREQALKS